MSDESKTMKLSVQLTEVKSRAAEMSEILLDVTSEKDNEAERRRAWKADIDAREKAMQALARAVRDRVEPRLVDVDHIPSVHRSTMEIYRRDTRELVYSRPMTQAEYAAATQAQLWEGDAPTVKTTQTSPA